MVEKIQFWGQIFKMEILTNLHVLRAFVFENHIFSDQSLCVPAISITWKVQEKLHISYSIFVSYIDASSLHRPDFSGLGPGCMTAIPAWSKNKNFGPGWEIEILAQAWSETKYKISTWVRPGQFFPPRFQPRLLRLNGF